VPELEHSGMHGPRLRRPPLRTLCAALAGSLTSS
jgi:hypothetical protein